MRPANRLQAPEPRRKIDPTATRIVSGVSVYGFRYYNPSTGRWISRDLIQERGGLNVYGMIGNDAINKTDRLGLEVIIIRVLSADELIAGSKGATE